MVSQTSGSNAPLHLSRGMQLLQPTRHFARTVSPTLPGTSQAFRKSAVQDASSGTSLQTRVVVVDEAEVVVVDAVLEVDVADVCVVVVVPVVVLLVQELHKSGQFACITSATAGFLQRSDDSTAHSGASASPLQFREVSVMVEVAVVDVVVVAVVVDVAVAVVFVPVTVVVVVPVAVVSVAVVKVLVTVVVVVSVVVVVAVTVVAVVVGRFASETSTSAADAPSLGNSVKLKATVKPLSSSAIAATIPFDGTNLDVTGENVATLPLLPPARPFSPLDVITVRRGSMIAVSTGPSTSPPSTEGSPPS